MKITINRQSVCMADDVNDHTLTYAINSYSKYSEIFEDLIHRGYFPNIFGNDVVWTLFCNNEDLISWKTKEDALYNRFVTEEPTVLKINRWAMTPIYFRYYSPPLKRAQYIFQTFNGSEFHIWHEGFMAEYQSYHISQSVEEDWRKTLLK